MTGDNLLGNAFDFLVKTGFLNTIVPFILFYSIVYGMLQRTQIFMPKDKKSDDEDVKNLNSLIAFAIAITATAASQAVGITQNYLPILAVASVVLLGVMMILGMAFGDKFTEGQVLENPLYKGIVWGAALILIIGALGVVAYYSGLIVPPCTQGSDLTPVNTLNPSAGQCTQFMDVSGFPDSAYFLGLDIITLLNWDVVFQLVTLLVLVVLMGVVIKYVTNG